MAILVFMAWAASPALAQMPGQGQSSANQEKQAAIQAMGPWLQALDAGNYAQAWKEAAPTFQRKGPCDSWVGTMKAIRAPYGPCQRRSVLTSIGQPVAPARGSLQGGGYFVLAQFDSYFPNQKHAVENVVFEKQPDKTWRAAGYSLQPKS